MYTIKKEDLKRLLIDSEILRRLQNGGVDNWINYSDALNEEFESDGKSFEDWEDDELPKLIQSYWL